VASTNCQREPGLAGFCLSPPQDVTPASASGSEVTPSLARTAGETEYFGH